MGTKPVKNKWVVALVEVDEANLGAAGLPQKEELSSLPDRLDEVIRKVAPNALMLNTVFILTDPQRTRLERYLEKNSLPYHEYAVESRGEHCRRKGCKMHKNQCIVIHLHDHIKKSKAGNGSASKK